MSDEATPWPQVVPMLAYRDAPEALGWLVKAFGFEERTRMEEPDGTIGHAELVLDDGGVVVLASGPPGYEGPRRHRTGCAAARAWSKVPWVINGVCVHVDDVDEHYAQAKGAGATILSEPESQPYGRMYRAEDLEGHRWMFMQSVDRDA
ncbi:MAG: VOC family protein [Actinomycetota bacterium]